MRLDITENLCHWIKASSDDEAVDRICSIISQRKILGANGFVKGSFDCVCFTESPYIEFHKQKHRYRKYGVMVSKEWVFKNGGRPVIYQPENEYHLLPESLKWRHVSFEPPHIDFSWEREWRINKKEIDVTPEEFLFLVPSEEIGNLLWTEYVDDKYRNCCGALEENDDYGKNWVPAPFRYRVISE
ncbi:hypothetical protein KOI40_00375 [Aestuariicella sp. G3-2]|uniref:abortive infection system antitoxin AbiGi family protein n=1 Tax=Pseudomaricurvus albidus TaxID=2842452 RepID=UPI001C0DF60E|nr:abortive infection system antitoxin AbiGi family protein [Aestuariicella albida]MBU3068269.1 hypothetical protein [Aestuariicella albida]